jgi:DNA-binding NarL/FixJ family response regulator
VLGLESAARDGAPTTADLTPRESEVLRQIARGLSNREIADQLFISVRTVERHISSIYAKIGADGTAARAVATVYAFERGLARAHEM